jgi:hypothetical protein
VLQLSVTLCWATDCRFRPRSSSGALAASHGKKPQFRYRRVRLALRWVLVVDSTNVVFRTVSIL